MRLISVFAGIEQLCQHGFNVLQIGDLGAHVVEACLCQLPNLAPVGSVIQIQQCGNLVEREAKPLRAFDETQAFDQGCRIVAECLARRGRFRLRQKADALVVADRLDAHAGFAGEPAYSELGLGQVGTRFHFSLAPKSAWRKRSALLITDTELKLMATLAIIGLNSQPSQG